MVSGQILIYHVHLFILINQSPPFTAWRARNEEGLVQDYKESTKQSEA